jgi:hypothetical protein
LTSLDEVCESPDIAQKKSTYSMQPLRNRPIARRAAHVGFSKSCSCLNQEHDYGRFHDGAYLREVPAIRMNVQEAARHSNFQPITGILRANSIMAWTPMPPTETSLMRGESGAFPLSLFIYHDVHLRCWSSQSGIAHGFDITIPRSSGQRLEEDGDQLRDFFAAWAQDRSSVQYLAHR